jgi:thymidine kinase
MPGIIELIQGPMFAGKTTELLRRYRRFKISNQKCVLVKYDKDNRYSENAIATHDNYLVFENVIKSHDLKEIKEQLYNYDVIFIDEAQFYENIMIVEELADHGKHIILSALSGTFKKTIFPNIATLIPLCEKITTLTAICHFCHHEAPFTLKTSSSDKIEEIGGQELYLPVCRKCYYQHNN